MKITKTQLKQIIKEELEEALEDDDSFGDWTQRAGRMQRSQFMEIAYNLYQRSGQTMSEDVKAALAVLGDDDLIKHISDASMAVRHYGWDRIHTTGGAEGLFQAILGLKESKI